MLSNKVAELINEQIMKEFYSAYLYLDMAGYYSDKGLHGFENWFTIQAQEERDHAMIFRTYLFDNNYKVKLLRIDAPDGNYESFMDPLKKTLEHEISVTASINNIYMAAIEEKDLRTQKFLDWFIDEQGEEEKNATDLITKFELFGNDSKGLYLLDQEFAARVYVPPTISNT